MKICSTVDLRDKEVINLCDGAKMGCPTDFEFDACDGRITALIVSGQGGFLGFGSSNDVVIPWCKIECIGEDAILVRIQVGDALIPENDRKKKKRYWNL